MEFEKTETYLIQGDYENAKKKSQVFFLSLEKNGKNEAVKNAALFQLARIYNGLGDFAQYEKYCKEGLIYINNKTREVENEYVFTLSEGIRTYLDHGDIVNASNLSFRGKNLIDAGIIKDQIYIHELNFLMAQVYYHQGFLLKAYALIAPIKKIKLSRIVQKEEITEAKAGMPKSRKLSSNEIKGRTRAYVDVLHFEINVLAENGLLVKADSLYKETKAFISKSLSNKDFCMVENLFIKGGIQEKAGEEKSAYEFYTSALDLYATSKGLHYTHYCKETARLFQKAVLIEEKIGKGKEGSKDQVSYDSKIKRYFGKKNFYFGQTILLEAEKDIMSGDKDDAKKSLIEILSKDDLLPAISPARVRAHKLLSSIYLLDNDFIKAEYELSEIIKIQKLLVGDQSPVYHIALLDLASFDVLYSNKFKEAENIFSNSFVKIIGKEYDHHSSAYLKSAYAQIMLYQTTERFAIAKELLEKLVSEIKNHFGEDHVNYAIASERSANLDMHLGLYGSAEKKLNFSIQYFNSHELHASSFYSNNMNCYIGLARLQILEGEFEEASKNLKKANKLSKLSDEYQYQKNGYCSEELTNLYINTGNYQDANKYLNEQIKIKEARLGNANRNLIVPYNQLGNLFLITGDYTSAEKYVRKAQAISLAIFGDSSIKFSESLKLLENIYTAIGDYERAEDAIKKVVEIQEAKFGMNHAIVANSLNDMAMVKFLNKKSKEEVEKLFLQSLSIIKKTLGDQTPQYAEVLKNISLFYLETGRIKEAEKDLEQLNNFWLEKLGKGNIHTAEINMLQGNILCAKGKYLDAKNKFIEGKNIYASIFDTFHPHYVKALSRIGQMNYILGEYKSCIKTLDETTSIYLNFIKKYFPSLSEREKNKFWSLIRNDFEFYNTLAVTLQASNPELLSNAYNFALHTKALLLNSSIKIRERIINSKDPVLIKKYENWVAKKEFLVTVISMSLDQRKANQVDVKSIEKEIEMMEKDLSASSELFSIGSEHEFSLGWEDIRESLQPNEVAVEMIRFRKFTTTFSDSIYYAALLITPQSKSHPELVLFKNGKDLESKFIKYYRNAIRLKSEDQLSYIHFWEPFGNMIKEKNTVYFSPDGVFSQINIETLRSPEGNYLADRNDIVLINSTRDIFQNERQAKIKKGNVETSAIGVSLFGNPTYYNNAADSTFEHSSTAAVKRTIQQLPGAEREVKALFDLLQSSKWNPALYMENDAQEEIVKNMKSPKVFHIATHGFFLEDTEYGNDEMEGINENRASSNPLMRAGLLLRNGGRLIEHDNVYDFNLEDGILTAYEAMNLNLDKTDLVVLSACETGLGEIQQGEGVYGLQRSFQVAGAKSIIMSLFKVSDEITQELMYNFYQKWIATGDKRKSFLLAKKEIKTKYPEPIYWGSFVMIGMN